MSSQRCFPLIFRFRRLLPRSVSFRTAATRHANPIHQAESHLRLTPRADDGLDDEGDTHTDALR